MTENEEVKCPICGATESSYGKPFTERTVKLHIKNSHTKREPGWNKRKGPSRAKPRTRWR